MKETILQMKNLSFSYEEGQMALNQVSVDLCRNEKIVVLGANGAGKSTFFLNMNGVREPEEGEIFLHGTKIEKKTRRELQKSVGIVFQDADSQMIASTVKAEVAFGPLNMKLPREEVERRTQAALKKLNLERFADRPPHYLSGGEKKRVGIADILAMEPEIIIFDEPTASLDPLHTELLEKILKELSEEGKTLLISTHDVDFAFRFADRALVFKEGCLIADGKTEDVFRDEILLEEANLKKPQIMQFWEWMKENHMIDQSEPCPRSLDEIKKRQEKRK